MADKEIANKFDPSIELAFQPDDNECPPSHAISQPGKIPVSECLPSHDISQPGKIPGGVSSSRTEPEADNQPLKQLFQGKEYGGARLKYSKPRVVTKSDADDQRETSSSNGLDSVTHSERSSVSSLSDVNFEKDSHKPKKSSPSPTKSNMRRTPSTSPIRQSPTKPTTSSSPTPTPPPDKIHIDSLKKKLIAVQIRQRMQTKNSSASPETESGRLSPQSMKKRRGRPPKISQEEYLSPKELELQVERTMRTPRAEEDVEQTMRTPCATEDSMHHGDTKSALAEPDLRDKGETKTEKQTVPIAEFQMVHPRQQNIVARLKDRGATARLPDDQEQINYAPTVVVLDTSSLPSSTTDIIPIIEKLLNFIDLKKVKKIYIIRSPDQKKSITKDIKNKLESEENIDKLESATSRKIETLVYKKSHIPAHISRILAIESICNNSQVLLVCDEDPKQLAVKLLDTRTIKYFPWSTLKPVALDQTNDKTLSEIGIFLKHVTSVTIFDADNCIKICESYIQQNPKLKFLVFGNEKTMKWIGKNLNVKNNKNVFFGSPSLAKKESADCDIVKVIVYIAVKYPHIKIHVVSDDNIFKKITKIKGKGNNSDVNNENPFSASIIILNPRTLPING